MCDVALDPYTSHGHDGIIINNKIDNDKTIEILQKWAIFSWDGLWCDFTIDMMDVRVGIIRKALDKKVLWCLYYSYAVKYASNFYGPLEMQWEVNQN